MEGIVRSIPIPWVKIKLVGEDGQLLAHFLQFPLRNRSPHKASSCSEIELVSA